MASRKFSQINAGILRSRKLAKCNHVEKWAYLCTHFTMQSNYIGIFRYQQVLWEKEAALTGDEFEKVIAKLTSLGLVEFDVEEEMVRVIGFHRQRPPENTSRVISMIKDFEAFVRKEFLFPALCSVA